MKRFLEYLNPLSHLGIKDYSIVFPILVSIITLLLSEFIAYKILNDPRAVGAYIIFIHVILIIYFSFRSGIFGGLTSVYIAILYYIYIMYDRNYTGEEFVSGVETTIILGLLFSGIALIIGYLKQKIDFLIEQEADEKRRLQTIIDQLPVGVVITDTKGKYVQGNKQIRKILGRDIRKEIYMDKLSGNNSKNKEERGNTHNQWPITQTLTTGKAISKKEFVIKNAKDKDVYVQISSALIKNSSGKPVAAASIISDVTAEKEIEKRKDDFVNMASHELKTPITSIKLYTDSLIGRLKLKADATEQKTLSGIKYQTDKLHDLVSDLLDISRLQTGKMNFNKDTIDLQDVTKETVEELQKTTKNHKLNLVLGSGKFLTNADKFRIYQVLTNLLTNAIKYSPNGGDVNVGIKKSGKWALVSVRDYGLGISKDQHKKIFERLYQVSDHKEKTFPGLGMGLYISKEIIKRHGGRIWVESTKGKGSTFYFTIPLSK